MTEKTGIVTQDNMQFLSRSINSILQKALAGYAPDFKSESGHVQWGKVQEAIANEIDGLWQLAIKRQKVNGEKN